jgi:hypothetical protein
MATLTGQYISQSYQGLINLSTNKSIVAGTMTQLQDGAGTNLGVFLDGQGDISGSSVTSSQDCLINNITVGRGNGNVSTNTAFGNSALFNNTTGASNTAIGRLVLNSNQSGSSNTAIGASALQNVKGDSNIAIGNLALRGNASSFYSNNIGIGNSTLFANTTGTDNIAIGHNALDSNTTGIRSIAIGHNALQAGTTVNNVAIGYNALYSNTTGSDNIGIGEETLYNNLSGNRNMAYGDSALFDNTSGGNNIALGINSLYNNVDGNANIAIGSEAGYNLSTGSNNIIIGYNMTGSTTMNSAILIGNNNSIKAHYTSSNWNFYDGVTVVSGSDLTVHGHKQFNVGSFSSTLSQSGSANVSQSITFNTTELSYGVTLSNNTRLNVTNAGIYNIQFSAQVDRVTGSGTDEIYIWLKKNGVNVANSAGVETISGAAAAAKTIAAWNYVVDAVANDYFELVWQSTDTNIHLTAVTASGNIPAIPSIIATLTQVR